MHVVKNSDALFIPGHLWVGRDLPLPCVYLQLTLWSWMFIPLLLSNSHAALTWVHIPETGNVKLSSLAFLLHWNAKCKELSMSCCPRTTCHSPLFKINQGLHKIAYIITLVFSQRNHDIDHPWGGLIAVCNGVQSHELQKQIDSHNHSTVSKDMYMHSILTMLVYTHVQ